MPFDEADWSLSSKYTGDDLAKEAKDAADAAALVASDAASAASEAQTKANEAAAAAGTAKAEAISAAEKYADDIAETLQGQIDGAIETWSGTVAPTASNEPAKDWTDDDTKRKHVGDLYYDTNTGYAYRYSTDYTWTLIRDTDVTKAIADAAAAQAAADNAQSTADTAKTNAAKAQTDAANAATAASEAKETADSASSTATEAKDVADAAALAAANAQTGVGNLETRVTTAESSISKNATDITLRATKKELQDLSVGGSNLILGTADWTIPNASVVYPMDYTVDGEVLRADVKPFTYSFRPPTLDRGTQYTFCVDALGIGASSEVTLKGFNNLGTTYFSTTQSVGNTDWVRISVTFSGYQSSYGNNFGIEYKEGTFAMDGDPYGIRLRHVQLVKGNKAPDWSPAYADLVAYTDAQVKVNANAIKAEVTKRTQTDANVSTLTQTSDGLRVDLTATQDDVETLNSYLEYADGTLTLGKNGDPSKVAIDNDSVDIVYDNNTAATFSASGATFAGGSCSISANTQGFVEISAKPLPSSAGGSGLTVEPQLVIGNSDKANIVIEPSSISIDSTDVMSVYGDVILANQLGIASGGTGAKSAADARTNLGAVSASNPTVTGTVTIGTYALTTDKNWIYGTGAAFNSICTQNSASYPVYGARVLYENASGTTGTATLVETAANFVYIEIFYAKVEGTNWSINSTKVFKPNGKRASLVAGQMAADNATIQLLIRTYNISGTSISAHTVSKYYNLAGATGTDSTAMRILAVVGYR